jgi:hypothetical protein
MDRPNKQRRNRTGPITIGVIFVFAIAVFAGFWFAKRSSNPAPPSAKFALPSRTIRVVSLDAKNAQLDRALDAINSIKPDIVLLQNVPTSEVGRIGEALHMSRAEQSDGDVFYPAQNFEGPAATFGNAIYSRFPLFEGRSIPNRGGSFGVWAVAVIGDAKIMVASVRTTDASSSVLGTQDAKQSRASELSMFVRAHDELGAPPMIIGGVFGEMDASKGTSFMHFGQSVAEHEHQRLFAFASDAHWQIVQVRVPDDLAGIAIDARDR